MDGRQISWTVGDGREARIEIGLGGRLDLQGYEIPGTYELRVVGTLSGVVVGYSVDLDAVRTAKVPAAIAWCGKLGLKDDIYAAYLTALAAVEADPRLVAYQAKSARQAAERAAYEAEHATIVRAMRVGE